MELSDRIRASYKDINKIEPAQNCIFFFAPLVEYVLPKEEEKIKFHITNDVLARFSSVKELEKHGNYMSDLERKARKTESDYQRYLIYVQMGSKSLFIVGIYPKYRNRKGLLDREYFNFYGTQGYSSAAQSNLSQRAGKDAVFKEIADNFPFYAEALNELAENFIPIGRNTMTDLMIEEQCLFKETKEKRYLESARKRAAILGITQNQYPSLFKQQL